MHGPALAGPPYLARATLRNGLRLPAHLFSTPGTAKRSTVRHGFDSPDFGGSADLIQSNGELPRSVFSCVVSSLKARNGMTILAMAVHFDDQSMWIELSDGGTLGVPLTRFPRLLHATREQRQQVELSCASLHWEAIDEDIPISRLLIDRGDGIAHRAG
jgi:hypothetical protein